MRLRHPLVLWLLLEIWCGGTLAKPFPDKDENEGILSRQRVLETTTVGVRKLGDPCDNSNDCTVILHGVCDQNLKKCQCDQSNPVHNNKTLCGKAAALDGNCHFPEQCWHLDSNSECKQRKCICRQGFKALVYSNGQKWCVDPEGKRANSRNGPTRDDILKGSEREGTDKIGTYVDPAMIGVLVGLILMFIILCVVLRMFSRARFQQNRTIFNTPNPRLMNVSLLKDRSHPGSRRPSQLSNLDTPPKSPNTSTPNSISNSPSVPKTTDEVTIELKDAKA